MTNWDKKSKTILIKIRHPEVTANLKETVKKIVEEVFEEDQEPILSASNIQFSEDDNVLVTGVSSEKNAIGFFGAAYYFENKAKLKAVPIINPEGRVLGCGIARFDHYDADEMIGKRGQKALIHYDYLYLVD